MSPTARLGRLIFVMALGVYVFSAGGSLTSTDAVVTFDHTRNIVEHRSLALSGNLIGIEALRGPDGRYYSSFGIGQALYDIPFYLAGKAVVSLTGARIGKPDSVLKAIVALGQTLVGAAIVWQTFAFAASITGDPGAAALAALTLAFGTILWPYSRFGFNQPLACLTLLVATRQVWLGVRHNATRRLVWAGGWLAVSLMTRHEMGAAVLPLAAWAWFDGRADYGARVRRLTAFAPGVLAGGACWLILNAVRFGNPLDAGYLRDPIPGFGSPIISGLTALLFSPTTSVFLYSPVAVAAVVGWWWLLRRDRSTALLLTSLVGLFLVFYASLGNWLGGRSYGSRYLVVVLPYVALGWAVVLASLSRRARRLAFAVAIALGIAVQMPGVLVDYAKVSQAAAAVSGPFTKEQRQWDWNASALVLNTRALARALPDNVSYVIGSRPVPKIEKPRADDDRGFSQQFSFSLDFWWLYLFYLRVLPRLAVAVILAGGGLFVAVMSWGVAREIGRVPDLSRGGLGRARGTCV